MVSLYRSFAVLAVCASGLAYAESLEQRWRRLEAEGSRLRSEGK